MTILKSVLLKGTINQTLVYPLTLVQNVREGEWQIALNNVSFMYQSEQQHPEPIPRVVLKITSNYVMTQDVNERNEIVTVPAVLSALRYGGSHGQCSTIGFKNVYFYTINNVEQNLIIKFETIDTGRFTTGAEVFLLILLRRVR